MFLPGVGPKLQVAADTFTQVTAKGALDRRQETDELASSQRGQERTTSGFDLSD